jgi:hypothetical protein
MAISAKMSNRKIRITPYMKNVGRSLGYAVGDAVAAYNPTISNILKTTKDTVSSAKTSIREMKANALAGGKDIMNSQNAFTNIIDDLKSGNWYNKSREDNIFGDMGFDDDFDFDDDNWGDDDESSPTEASNFIDEATSSKSIAKAIIGSSTSQTKAYGKASAVSADYIVKSTNKSLSAMYQLNAQGFSQVSELLLSVNTTLTGIATLGQPLSEHIQNSAVFFTEATQKLESIDNKLEKISNSLSVFDGIVNKKKSGSNRRITLGDMLFDGQFDMSTYMDMVKENYKSVKDLYSGLLDMGSMMAGKGGKNLSPLATAMKYSMQALIPKFARESMTEFNKTLSETIGVALTRGTKKAKSKGGILGFLADIFGIDDRSTKFSTAGYDKGPMQWDGVAKQALVNVIPTYLAKIYAKLGGEEKYYNYETGKYETLKTIREREDESTANYAKRAGGQFRQDLLAEVDKLNDIGNKDIAKSEIEDFILNCYIHNIDLSDLLSGLSIAQMKQKFGLSEDAAKALRSYVGESSGKRKSKGSQQLLRFENDIIIEKRKQSRIINDASSSGISELSHLYDAFGENVGALHSDSTMQIKYLKGLYELSANIQQNLAYLARRQGARIKYTPYDIDDNLGSSYQQAASSFKYAHEVSTGGRNAQYYIDNFGMTEDEYKLKTFDMNYGQILKWSF